MDLKFEWDKDKAASNLKKHKVSFEEASRIFSARKATRKEHKDYEENVYF